MGRGKRGRTQRKHFKENRENVWKKTKSENNTNTTATPWEDFVTQNPAFEEYYKEQEIVSPEEWDKFLQVLHKALPAAFRINSSGQFFKDIRSQLENDFMKNLEMEVTDSDEVDAIRPLPWYPDNLAWHSNYSRMQLRKNQTLAKFHEFLKQANEIGNITRQEAVSMVPPLFLDVRPEHFILDMCAAPGSKTFQLLEIIHQSSDSGVLPAGTVIANDVDVQRCNLLIHQTKRMCSANLIVTNHEAQHFPGCHVNKSPSNKLQNVEGLRMSQLLFDRILCDVPCSGDGTLRKAPDIWRKWTAGMGNGVHRLQVEIAMRGHELSMLLALKFFNEPSDSLGQKKWLYFGVNLLNIGGRMVYSTCSMNPVENEAVVAEILRRSGGSVELLDVSSELPQLVCRPGLKKWKVRDKGLWLASYKDVPKYRRNVIFPSMFPSGRSCESETIDIENPQKELGPSDNTNDMEGQNGLETEIENGATVDIEQPGNLVTESNTVEVEVSCLPLERCMRIVPHDQNTGAFFIAVLKKLSSLPVCLEKNSSKNGNQNGHSTYVNHQVVKGSSEKIVEETSVSEIDPPEDKNHEQSALDDADPDTESLDKLSEEGGLVEDNEAEEVELHENGETGDQKERGGRKRLQNQGRWRGVDPVVIFRDEATINGIREFYGISESFPFHNHLVTRNNDVEHVKRIYYISKSVRDVLELNIHVGQRLKITSVGLKIFERQTNKEGVSSPCLYRISSEGLPLLLPHITKQILCASLADFRHLLQYRSIKFEDFVDAKFGEAAAKLSLGCCVIVLAEGDQTVSDPIQVKPSTIAIGCWKGRTNVSLMVSSADSEELLERLSVRLGSKDTSREDTDGSTMEIEANEGITKIEGNPATV